MECSHDYDELEVIVSSSSLLLGLPPTHRVDPGHLMRFGRCMISLRPQRWWAARQHSALTPSPDRGAEMIRTVIAS